MNTVVFDQVRHIILGKDCIQLGRCPKLCIAVLIPAWVVMFKIRLLVGEIIGSDSRKVEDTKKLCPASEGILDCLCVRDQSQFVASLLCLEMKLSVDEFLLEPVDLRLKF